MAPSPSSALSLAEKFLFPLILISLISLFLFLSTFSYSTSSILYSHPSSPPFLRGPSHPPSFAYLLSGHRSDSARLIRLLLALYHPRNRYLLYLSADASEKERVGLVEAVKQALPVSLAFGNVDVVGRPSAGTPMGSSELAGTLGAAAAMLRLDHEWDWFVTLSAADYPLLTQDDLIHVFSSVPRHLNFIDHTSDIGWKEQQRVQPIIVDAGVYLAGRKQYFQASEKRATPDAFKFFTGSPWVILSRQFIEYCTIGYENLPRTLLLYFTNVLLSQEGYFHSVICNSGYRNTTVNNDLRFTVWDDPPQMEPHYLSRTDFSAMVESGVPFARKFKENDAVLDLIDRRILGKWRNLVTPGAWCTGSRRWWRDPCSQWGNVNTARPGPQAERFQKLMDQVLKEWESGANSCQL
ncbi:core-2/I-branching beta-1,6-N-acetylglucosaminyltransferase family protein [Carex rostrata]